MEAIRTVTLEAGRLIDALDNLADVPAVIERHADGHGPLEDRDTLIATLRGIIADFAFARNYVFACFMSDRSGGPLHAVAKRMVAFATTPPG